MIAALALLKAGPALLIAGLAAVATFFLKAKVDGVARERRENELAQAIVENHAAASQAQAAKTDGEADAALDALSRADRR